MYWNLARAGLKAVPLWAYYLLGAAVASVLLYQVGQYKGKQEVQADWDASRAKGKAIVADLKNKADIVTIKTEYIVQERIKTVEVKGDTIYKTREVFVPVDSGYLSGGFRLFFDGAFTNTVPDPARIPDSPPVAIADVADTIAINATQCHKAYEIVRGWQEWSQEQLKVNGAK